MSRPDLAKQRLCTDASAVQAKEECEREKELASAALRH